MTHAEIDLVLTSRRWCLYETSVVPSFCTGSDHCVLRAMIRLSRMLEKKSCHRPGSTCQAVYCGDILSEILSNHDRQLKKDLTGDYELLVKGPKSCAESASVTPTRSSDRISTTTKELLEERRKLKLDLNATHVARVI
ncbi:hypothetical protein KIN20_026930 [Parelaphostrongylus tenuis]|uniref:Uncharacterized protein n=1 Tax=Parelaphostrongylus tenuis TaxID=148309 RepID=A0AAD5QYQ1_PARTN|nr:hypothetical protein KIN20_026930 [Parelaphostrongylus tenuis]